MRIEISPEPNHGERAAITTALATLLEEQGLAADAWWQAGLPDGRETEFEATASLS